MFEIEYYLSVNNEEDIVNVDDASLRYHLFLGGIILKKDFETINFDWDWIPLLDFAICLQNISNSLLGKTQGEEEFEFTESDSKISFARDREKIIIRSSLSNEILDVEFHEFQSTVRKFYKQLILEIAEKNRNIKDNDAFVRYLNETEKM